MCLFSNRESSELVGMRYDSRDMFKNAALNALTCLFLAVTF